MRFMPDHASKPPVIQEADVDLFTKLYRAGVLTTSMIMAIDRRGRSVVYDRLHRLVGHSWLAKVPNDAGANSWDPNRQDLFTLGCKGVPIARERCGFDRRPIREQDIAHALDTATFVLSLERALAAGGRELKEWLPDGTVEFSFADTTIYPDGLLTIRDQGQFLRITLEVDRSSESGHVFRTEKIERYAQFWASPERHEQAPWPFRVVVITRSEARKENLRRLAREYGPRQSLFWFTSSQQFTFKERDRVLDPIFQTARDDAWRALLDVS